MRYCSETEKKINFHGGACDQSWKYLNCIMTPWRNHRIRGWQQYSSFYSLSRAPLEDDFLKEGAFCKVALMQSELFSTLPSQMFILGIWSIYPDSMRSILCSNCLPNSDMQASEVYRNNVLSMMYSDFWNGSKNIRQIFRDSIQSFFCFYHSFSFWRLNRFT